MEEEAHNSEDRFTVYVAVLNTREIVGHVPRELSRIVWYFTSSPSV